MRFKAIALLLVLACMVGSLSVPMVFAKPDELDVMFCFDLSSSMQLGGRLDAAKQMAKNIMGNLSVATWLSARFGVITYVDYPSFYNSCGYAAQYGVDMDYPYYRELALKFDTDPVKNTIDTLPHPGLYGWDPTQCYSRVMYEGYSDAGIGWRDPRFCVRLMMNFGDDVPHDCNVFEGIQGGVWSTGRDPGRDGIVFTEDDIDLQDDAIPGLVANGIEWFEIHYGIYRSYWAYWAGLTDGKAYAAFTTDPCVVFHDILGKVYERQNIGGFVIPVDKLGILAPYIDAAAVVIVGAVVAVFAYRRKKED